MKILVIGASGKTGQKLLVNLSETEHEVVGLIRKQDQINLLEQYGAQSLLGDLASDIKDLADGFDAIIFVAGSRGKNVHEIDYEGLAKTIDSALLHHVKRFLYISSINIGKEPHQFIDEMKNYYSQHNEIIPEKLLAAAENPNYKNYLDKKLLAENKIIQSGINYTILRAGLLTEEDGSGKIFLVENTLNAFGKVSRDNVANCFIASLENKNTFRKIFTVLDGNIPIENAFAGFKQ